MTKSKLIGMNNMDIVVEYFDKAIPFFTAIGLKLEGRTKVEGECSGRVRGLKDQSVEMAMMVTPDGHGRPAFSRFIKPLLIAVRSAPCSIGSLLY